MSIISQEQLNHCQRLLFMSPVALGDFLYLKTFLIALKQQNPHIELDIWLDDNRCNTDAWRLSRSKILQQWIEAEPAFNRSFGCTDSVAHQTAQIAQAKQHKYDVIICHSGSKSQQFSALARQISPDAFIVSSIAKAPFKGLLNKIIFRHSDSLYQLDANRLAQDHHITDRFYTILHDIAGLTLSKPDFMPALRIDETYRSNTQQWLIKAFGQQSGKIILINYLSTNTKRDWSEEQVVELIELILQHRPDGRVVLNVTKEQYPRARELVASSFAAQQSNVAVFTVQEHFFELPAMIAAADLVITVETAIMHFATAAHTPLIALMRAKKPYWAPPTSDMAQVLYASQGKGYVSDISVKNVYETYISMI